MAVRLITIPLLWTLVAGCNEGSFEGGKYKKSPNNGDSIPAGQPGLPDVPLDQETGICSAADIIDFESFPDGTLPSARATISNQYYESHGVRFSLIDGGLPMIAERGGSMEGFVCDTNCGAAGANDTDVDGEGLGNFFLSNLITSEAVPKALIISYRNPVAQASGLVFDVDASETWNIEAQDDSGAVIASQILSGQGSTYDGRGMRWRFSVGDHRIHQILFKTNTQDIGLGFDRFSPTKVCD